MSRKSWVPKRKKRTQSKELMAQLEIKEYLARRVLIVSLDIGKDVNYYYIRKNDLREVIEPTQVRMIRKGFDEFVGMVDKLIGSGEYDLVLLGHEPTGIYHEPWMYKLSEYYATHRQNQTQPQLRYRLVSPYQVKQERQRLSARYRKTDAIDTKAIANLLAEGNGNEVFIAQKAENYIRLYYQQIKQESLLMRLQKMHLLNLFDRLWPGALGDKAKFKKAHPKLEPPFHLVDSKAFERETVRILFQHCPNPYIIREMSADEIRLFFHQHNAQCGPKTAQRILAVAKQAVLLPPDHCQLLASQLQERFATYLRYEEQIQQYYTKAAELLSQTTGEVLLSYPGMGEKMAVQYMAGIISPERFNTAAELWAYAGFDTNLSETGNKKSKKGMSKKGNPFLRKTLYQIGWLAIRHNPDCHHIYKNALAKGKSKKLAVIHVAHKVNRILFAMLRDQMPYQTYHQ